MEDVESLSIVFSQHGDGSSGCSTLHNQPARLLSSLTVQLGRIQEEVLVLEDFCLGWAELGQRRDLGSLFCDW